MLSELNEQSKLPLLRLLSKSEYYDLVVTIGDEVSNRDANMRPDF